MAGWGNAIGFGLGKGLEAGFEGYKFLKALQADQEERDARAKEREAEITLRREAAAAQAEREATGDRRNRGKAVFDLAQTVGTDAPLADSDVADAEFAGYGAFFDKQTDRNELPGRAIGDTQASPGRMAGNYRKRTAAEVQAERTRVLADLAKRQEATDARTEWDRRTGVDQTNALDRIRTTSNLTATRQAEDDARRPSPSSLASTGGRPMLAGDARSIGDLDQSIALLDELEGKVGGVGVASRLGATIVPDFVTEATGIGGDAKRQEAMIRTARQIIGKAMEGGVLRKEDEAKYEAILPKIGDAPDVAQGKIEGLRKLLRDKREAQLESLGSAGFHTAGYQTPPMMSRAPSAPGVPAGVPKPSGAAFGAPAAPAAGRVRVETPSGPVFFKDTASADAFKRAAGIQ